MARFDAEPTRRRRRGDPGRPDQGPAFDRFITDQRAVGVAARNLDPEPQLDPEPLQRLRRHRRQTRRKARQQPRSGLDEDDPRRGRVDMAKVAGERRLGELGERPGELDPGRAAADDDKGQEPAALGIVLAVFGAFEGEQDAPPHRGRLLDRLQRGGDRRPLVMAEIGVARAGRDHELVIGQAAVADQHRTAVEIDAADRAEHDIGVRLPSQNAADRPGDVGRRQSRGCNLVQQWLKEMIVAAVDDRHVRRRSAEMGRGLQPAETGADNNDARARGGEAADGYGRVGAVFSSRASTMILLRARSAERLRKRLGATVVGAGRAELNHRRAGPCELSPRWGAADTRSRRSGGDIGRSARRCAKRAAWTAPIQIVTMS